MRRKISGYQIFLFSLCPVTLVFGHILSYWLNIDADKDGWFNVYFVKRGWFWTSVVGWWCFIRYRGLQQVGSWKKVLLRYVVLTAWWLFFTQSIISGAAPIMDIVFTLTGGRCNFDVFDPNEILQWKLNEKFHDTVNRRQRSLAKLYNVLKDLKDDPTNMVKHALSRIESWVSENKDQLMEGNYTPGQLNEYIDEILHRWRKINSSNICQSLGGQWIGGHDPSGHIFLITLMSMFLLGELQAIGKRAWRALWKDKAVFEELRAHCIKILTLKTLWGIRTRRSPVNNVGDVRDVLRALVKPPLESAREVYYIVTLLVKYVFWNNPVILLVVLVGMWWWSFLITTIVFHTLWEQLSGLICAYIVATLVYLNIN
ncbi:LAMI_0G08790g1_1 [Lachancea mirantina]|uniref:Acyl-coenzyme A diphosphatase SCS3 n=1 Tax=Lachancea mirantina TaxID=1230905 RepID=A0A1G4KA09_9SACH|nr:LAMI_0G08790g1_1 [Lachancea mirantina]